MWFAMGINLMLDDSQQSAVDGISKLDSKIYLLTGSGGSGKTFTLQYLLNKLWADEESGITNDTTFLCSPTGKASKVIASSLPKGFLTNEPSTVHRLLEYNPAIGWLRCAEYKLNASLVIIDESSMCDSMLLSRVIAAIPDNCHLILVGDVNQLPPVAPGQPFADLINLGDQRLVHRLTTNHRQTQGSLIATACLSVLDGKMPVCGEPGEHTLGGELEDDLFLHEEEDKEDIPEKVMGLCEQWHRDGVDYAVLAPQKTGVCGVDAINSYLQDKLNPADPGKNEIKVAWVTLREGDKVLATKNNYKLNVFNGYTGIVTSIFGDTVVVDFDGQVVEYEEREDIKQLTLGYCMTIHKSQGSTIDYGVFICHSSHYYMQSRGLLYTAISRFRKELHVVGDKRAIKRGLSNVLSDSRNTYIKLQLQSEK